MRRYVRMVEGMNRVVGRIIMFLLFGMMAILLWSSISKTFFLPSPWTLEMAQFSLTAYYMLGGPYALQLGTSVRMDLFYSGRSQLTKAWIDAFTVFFLIFFLGALLYGGISSTTYSLEYGERSATAWRPVMWPIKIIMCVGIVLMLLQAIAELFKDILRIRTPDTVEVEVGR